MRIRKSRKGLGLRRETRGASLVEYVLLVALLAVVAIPSISFLGTETSCTFQRTALRMRPVDSRTILAILNGEAGNPFTPGRICDGGTQGTTGPVR